ncbi:hypothetical protein FVEN_g12651 [Fusarium venenatum]|nr:hypothetical protein FVEN_g12651 [Fusarium venenatum]
MLGGKRLYAYYRASYGSNNDNGRKHASGYRPCFFFRLRSIFNHNNNIVK